MSKIIPKELNFAHEAENAEKTRNFFKNNPNVRVPKIHYNYSSVKIYRIQNHIVIGQGYGNGIYGRSSHK